MYISAVLACLVPTFALGFVRHLVLFQSYYEALAMYRRDIVIPFGFVSMLIQAAIFAWLYGVVGALLSWSFTTLAVAAKNVMASPGNGVRPKYC